MPPSRRRQSPPCARRAPRSSPRLAQAIFAARDQRDVTALRGQRGRDPASHARDAPVISATFCLSSRSIVGERYRQSVVSSMVGPGTSRRRSFVAVSPMPAPSTRNVIRPSRAHPGTDGPATSSVNNDSGSRRTDAMPHRVSPMNASTTRAALEASAVRVHDVPLEPGVLHHRAVRGRRRKRRIERRHAAVRGPRERISAIQDPGARAGPQQHPASGPRRSPATPHPT